MKSMKLSARLLLNSLVPIGKEPVDLIIDDEKTIHGAPINVDIEKDEIEGWNINMEITDTYDFTDFKNLKEYVTSNKSLPMSIFSTILNNFGVVSSEYGVIKKQLYLLY
ncbi:MAG: hypothetical protein IJE68_06615 [Clostridia bacterium]|nr:hypothetical protein [Clostridia bacterium]